MQYVEVTETPLWGGGGGGKKKEEKFYLSKKIQTYSYGYKQ